MLKIENLYTVTADDNTKVLKGLNLDIKKGEIHVIMGPNGSGKSTLANTILANPKYIVENGKIEFEGEDITSLDTTKRARKGIFMSFQTPCEVEGVSMRDFLKTAKANLQESLNLYQFAKDVEENMSKLDMDKSYLDRYVNVGFSGGERKKCEILQLLTLNPKLAILDETDSGLDVDAIKIVKEGIKLYKNSENAILIITHSMKLIEDLKVDYVHVLVDGKIVDTGDISLALDIDRNGYKKYLDEN